MLADQESDLAERKETFKGDAPMMVRETVCAFANDLPDHRRSGVVFIGARDDGTPSGLVVTDNCCCSLQTSRPTATSCRHRALMWRNVCCLEQRWLSSRYCLRIRPQ